MNTRFLICIGVMLTASCQARRHDLLDLRYHSEDAWVSKAGAVFGFPARTRPTPACAKAALPDETRSFGWFVSVTARQRWYSVDVIVRVPDSVVARGPGWAEVLRYAEARVVEVGGEPPMAMGVVDSTVMVRAENGRLLVFIHDPRTISRLFTDRPREVQLLACDVSGDDWRRRARVEYGSMQGVPWGHEPDAPDRAACRAAERALVARPDSLEAWRTSLRCGRRGTRAVAGALLASRSATEGHLLWQIWLLLNDVRHPDLLRATLALAADTSASRQARAAAVVIALTQHDPGLQFAGSVWSDWTTKPIDPRKPCITLAPSRDVGSARAYPMPRGYRQEIMAAMDSVRADERAGPVLLGLARCLREQIERDVRYGPR